MIWAMYIVAAEKRGIPRAQLARHAPERHPEGVHRPERVHLPARALDAAGDRHGRVRHAASAALEHDLDQRLPHPRGGLDRRAGAGLHARRRHRLRRGRARARPRRRHLRAAPLLLLQHPQRLLRGDRQVPRRPPDLGASSCRSASARRTSARLDALPLPDGRRLAHRAAAPEQHGPHRHPGPGRGPGRHPIAAHQLATTRPWRCPSEEAVRSPCARSRSSPTRVGVANTVDPWAAATSSRR